MEESKIRDDGPWRLHILGNCLADLSDKGTFMGLTGGSGAPDVFDDDYVEEWEARARLIEAAPDLLKALKYARRYMFHTDHDTVWIDGVIAKAESK